MSRVEGIDVLQEVLCEEAFEKQWVYSVLKRVDLQTEISLLPKP